MQVDFRTMPRTRCAAVRHIGPYEQVGEACMKLGEWAAKVGVAIWPLMALYHDNPQITPASELRSDAAVAIPEDFTLSGDNVHEEWVPGGAYIVATYVGHYSGLGQAWGEFVGRLIPESGRQFAEGPMFDRYIDDCAVTPENELRTELWAPIKG